MSPGRTRLLYVTDLGYEARGREYSGEDIYLSSRLREHFDIALCHPRDAVALMLDFDAVMIRNSGPTLFYQDEHDHFRASAISAGVPVFTELTGKADMAGKQYLVDLYAAGLPVIPTVDRHQHLDRLPEASEFVVKPTFGADSVGLRFLQRADLDGLDYEDLLVQPRIDFRHEISFYFVDRTYYYALYAPDPHQRWALEPYQPSDADLAFAQLFIDWNDIDHGIQRVDACRTQSGDLLLVELEDLNPYLSLELVDAGVRDQFVKAVSASLQAMLDRHR